jgi:tetratricopeptide (TPR) repeat protein
MSVYVKKIIERRRLFAGDDALFGVNSVGRKLPHAVTRAFLLVALVLIANSTNAHAEASADCNNGTNAARRIRACTQVIESTMISDTISIAYMNRGIARAERHEPSKALADFSSSIAANSSNGVAYYNRGNVYFDLQKLRQARADYSKAIEFEPGMVFAFLNRGLVNEKLGDHASSFSDYQAALGLDPTLAAASAGLKRLEALPVSVSSPKPQ